MLYSCVIAFFLASPRLCSTFPAIDCVLFFYSSMVKHKAVDSRSCKHKRTVRQGAGTSMQVQKAGQGGCKFSRPLSKVGRGCLHALHRQTGTREQCGNKTAERAGENVMQGCLGAFCVMNGEQKLHASAATHAGKESVGATQLCSCLCLKLCGRWGQGSRGKAFCFEFMPKKARG